MSQEWTFRLTVTDNDGATSYVDIVVPVEAEPPAPDTQLKVNGQFVQVQSRVRVGGQFVTASLSVIGTSDQSSTFPMTLPFTLA